MPDTFFTVPPEWTWWIILYFFIGGIAGGSFFLASILYLVGRPADRPLVRLGYYVALIGAAVSGILLIVDEVQTGFGRTGKFFAHEHAGITPDIMVMAKGMGSGFPISAVMSRAIGSVRASIASAARWKIAARAGAGSAAHAGKAAAAAATAAWTSATPDAWKTPVTSDGRQGSCFSYVSPESASRHSPPT